MMDSQSRVPDLWILARKAPLRACAAISSTVLHLSLNFPPKRFALTTLFIARLHFSPFPAGDVGGGIDESCAGGASRILGFVFSSSSNIMLTSS